MNIIKEAYRRLFNKELSKEAELIYREKKGFNSEVRLIDDKIYIILGKDWKVVNDEIKIGLIQVLLLKLFKKNKTTTNIDLYHNFVKSLAFVAEKNKTNKRLEEIFNRVNQKYFYGLMDMPNLLFGRATTKKLASYDFLTDTIIISSIFKNAPDIVLEYLIFHELLHKKYKFKARGKISFYHTKEFKEMEKKFQNLKEVEKIIEKIIRKKLT